MPTRKPPDRTPSSAPPPQVRRVGRPSNERFRQVFTRNLNQLLDLRPEVPVEPAARASELARVCGVTPAAARKWLTGAGWPTLEKLLDLAQRYGFAPDDLLSDGPRQVIDISRLVDAQALRRAELGELTPVPEFGSALPRLAVAIDASLLFDVSLARAAQSAAQSAAQPAAQPYALFIVPDDSMLPICSQGDRVVFRVEGAWTGDGLYLIQQTAVSPLMLRTVTQAGSSYKVTSGSGSADGAYLTGMFAEDEAGALNGAPIIRGRPVGLIRKLPGAAN